MEVIISIEEEMNKPIDTLIDLTLMYDCLDPHDGQYQKQENSMMNFRGELMKLQSQYLIVSGIIIYALNEDKFCEDFTRRATTGGLSVHKVYSLRNFGGTKSTLISEGISNA